MGLNVKTLNKIKPAFVKTTAGTQFSIPRFTRGKLVVGVAGFARPLGCAAVVTITMRSAFVIYSLSNQRFSSAPLPKIKPATRADLFLVGVAGFEPAQA